jgi:signal peptide peptidase SppA
MTQTQTVAERRPTTVDSSAPGPGPILSEAWFATPRCVEQLLAQVARVDIAAERPQPIAAGPPQSTNGPIRIVDIRGPMLKYAGFWTWVLGGVSTFELRNAINSAAFDSTVAGIVLRIHSPGGEVAGTDDLALAIREASKRKPVVAFIEDMGASAAYYVASQAGRIVATESALVGSLGVLTIISDRSVEFSKAGVTVHVVGTADLKGMGVAGKPVTEADIEELTRIVQAAGDLFMRRVADGRRLPMDRVRAVFDARMYTAGEASKLGLIDAVGSMQSVLTELAAPSRMGPRASVPELRAALPSSADYDFIREAWAAHWTAEEAAAEFARRQASRPASLAELRAELPTAPMDFLHEAQTAGLSTSAAGGVWHERESKAAGAEASRRERQAQRDWRRRHGCG